MTSKKNFVIVSTPQYSGGSIVLHALCKYILELGYTAKIFTVYGGLREKITACFWLKHIIRKIQYYFFYFIYKIFNEKIQYINIYNFSYRPIDKLPQKYLPFVNKNTIVIYPESIYGNPLHAKKVIRWLLSYPNYPDGSYKPNDLFYCYRVVFNNKNLNPSGKQLHIPFFDLNMYKQTNYGSRKGKCYIIRKGKKRPDLPRRYEGIIIDNLPENEKVQIFNSCEYCICYDMQTAYSKISAMCGCITVNVPETGKKWQDYYETKPIGVAFGFDEEEIEYAKKTRGKIKSIYEEENMAGLNKVKKFIKEIEKLNY